MFDDGKIKLVYKKSGERKLSALFVMLLFYKLVFIEVFVFVHFLSTAKENEPKERRTVAEGLKNPQRAIAIINLKADF